MSILLAVSALASLFHYVRTNSDGSEPERVVVYLEAPERVAVFKARERCTNAAYVTAELDPSSGQARSLAGGRLGRDLSQQQFAWFSNPPGRAQARLGSPQGDPVFDVPVGQRWFAYDFDFADWIAHPPSEIRAHRDFSIEMVLLLTGEGQPTMTNRGKLELTFAARGKGPTGEFVYYRAGGEALENRQGSMWFDAGTGRLLAARLPLANHSEYTDFAYTLVKEEDGAAAWQAVLADHWQGCPPTE